VLGYHYFAADGTPISNLNSVGRSFYGKKSGDPKAPANANKVPTGTGAVDRLQLQDKDGSIGLPQLLSSICMFRACVAAFAVARFS
jgi:hypothetical protein